MRPLLVKLLKSYTWLASKLNERWGYPFFLLLQNIHQILNERLARKVTKIFNEFFILNSYFNQKMCYLKINRKDYTQILIDAQSDDFKIEDYNAEFDDTYKPSQIEKKLTYNVRLRL